MIIEASASAWAAPPMSFFMLRMPDEGLRSSPPESKHTPLPTSVTLGARGLPQVKSIRRGARERSAPHRVDRRIAGLEQRIADDRFEFGFVAAGHRDRRVGQFGRPHVGGGGVDEVPHQRDGLGGAFDSGAVGSLGPHQPRAFGLGGFLIASEPVAGQSPGERRPLGLGFGEGGGDAVGTLGQLGG